MASLHSRSRALRKRRFRFPIRRGILSLALLFYSCFPSAAQWAVGIQSGVDFPLLLQKELFGYHQSLAAPSFCLDLRFRTTDSEWMPRLQIQYSRIQVPASRLPPLVAVLHYHRGDLRLVLAREKSWNTGTIFYGGGLGASALRSYRFSLDRNHAGDFDIAGGNWSTAWMPHIHLMVGWRTPLGPHSRWSGEIGTHINLGYLIEGAEPSHWRITFPTGQSTIGSVAPYGLLLQPGISLGLQYALGPQPGGFGYR